MGLFKWIALLAVVAYYAYGWWRMRTTASKTRSKSGVVLITGASAGIGEAIAVEYAKQKNKTLVLAARRTDKLVDVRKKCLELGAPDVLLVTCDVSKKDDCAALMQVTIDTYGRLDTLVLNAGVIQSFWFKQLDNLDELSYCMDVNYYGSLYCTHFALPHLIKTQGSIAVISSVAGYLPGPTQSLYHGSKHALEGFFKSLRPELIRDNVAITMINPGFIATDMASGFTVRDKEGKMLHTPDKPSSLHNASWVMTAEACARQSVQAIDGRAPRLIVPFYYGIAVLAYSPLPDVVEFLSLVAMVGWPKKKSSPPAEAGAVKGGKGKKNQ